MLPIELITTQSVCCQAVSIDAIFTETVVQALIIACNFGFELSNEDPRGMVGLFHFDVLDVKHAG